MMPIHTILLTLNNTVTALSAPEEFQKVGIRGCGTNVCSGYVAKGEADCTFSCMWGKCAKYSYDGDLEVRL
jgi:hypothetical protein